MQPGPRGLGCLRVSDEGRDRKPLARRGWYAELFLPDEAIALAAGQRPCATCRRDRFKAFIAVLVGVHDGPAEGRSLPQTIDRALLRARIGRDGTTGAADLPDGTIIARERERRPDCEGDHAPLGGGRGGTARPFP